MLIILGIILLVIGFFVARNILWPVGGILLLIGLILYVVNSGAGTYSYY